MRRQLFAATALWMLLLSTAKASPVLVDEERLIRFLIDRQQQFASPNVRPVINSSNPVKVQFLFILNSIVEVDEKEQTITTKANTQMVWTDEFLSWDPSQYGGRQYVFMPSESVWLPDIFLENNKDTPPVEDTDNKVTITSQGVITVGNHFLRTSACVIQMEQYPYDQQNCSILFRSELYSETDLQLVLFSNRTVVSEGAYEPNPEWDLVASGAEIAVWNVDGFDYHFAQINIVIRRRPGFYIYILVVPSLLLSTLTPLLFWMPPSRPDRTTLGLSLFSSFFVLLLVLVQKMPSSASQTQLAILSPDFHLLLNDHIDMITLLSSRQVLKPLTLTLCNFAWAVPPQSMTLIAVSTMLSACVIYVSNKSLQVQQQPIPFVVEKIFVEVPSKLSVKRLMSSSCFRSQTELTLEQALPTDIDLENQEKWKAVAASLDKLFFTVACTAVILAIAVLFPH